MAIDHTAQITQNSHVAQERPALEAFSLARSRRTAQGDTLLWRSPDIVVLPGQVVALLGQRQDVELALGLLSGLQEPSGGVLRFNGRAAEDLPRRERARLRAREVGLLFRGPQLLPDLSILDNVALPQRFVGVPPTRAKERARYLLQRLGLDEVLLKKPADLSPLQAQLVSLARALVNRPAVILADEPTAELPTGQAQGFLQSLVHLCEEEHAAILLGTSDPTVAACAAHTVRLTTTAAPPVPFENEMISTTDLWSELYEGELMPLLRPAGPFLDLVLKPLLYTSVVALVIVFLTFFGLTMAAAGQATESIDLGRAITQALSDASSFFGDLLRGRLGTYATQEVFYYWTTADRSIAEAVQRTLGRSLALLLLSMALGGAIGVPLGLVAALVRHRKSSLLFLVAAIVGVSTPSFFLALLLQILEVSFYRRTGVALLPVGGFGWDSHIVLPALVLAARPIAQVARVAFVSLSEVLDADYIRTAYAKGLLARHVLARHALRNAGVPILAAMGSSLGFSLSSLPIVEVIFQWPGVGDMLLNAIRTQQARLAAALALLLGVLFVVTHIALNWLYRWIDPRLRGEKTGLAVQRSWVDLVATGWSGLRELPDRLDSVIPWLRKTGREQPAPLPGAMESTDLSEAQRQRDAKIREERRRAWVQSTAGSLPFVVGGIILAALLGAVVLGQQLAPYSAYTAYSSLQVDGELRFAPFPPSAMFALGTDPQGRDVLTLLLYGARRTLSLAFFAVLARILVGFMLGALAGWFSDSLLDRAIMGMTQVIAAFPALLLAMVLIYAFGIRQGLWVFAAALCLIGWGEPAQLVRGKVMHIREQDYVEGALATGLGDLQLLMRHVLPNLVPSLVVLACLEMSGVLMILGELGFVGVFIGGGTRTTSVADSLVRYFDVPEWGVMLSNTWRSFRSYPWMTFYPALAFTFAIVGFNLFGEGLRRLTERLTLSMHRIINRYTVAAALGAGVLFLMAAEATGSWAQFAPIATRFDSERAIADIRYLASAELEGRGVGSPGLEAAAEYIAGEFAALGLQPAGPEVDGALSYFVPVPYEYKTLTSAPSFELFDSSGQVLLPLTYRQDYAEVPEDVNRFDKLRAQIVCVGMNPEASTWPDELDMASTDLLDKVILLPTRHHPLPLHPLHLRAVLIVVDDDDYLTHRQFAVKSTLGYLLRVEDTAYLFISPSVADAILRHGGSSLEEVRHRVEGLRKNQGFVLNTGVDAAIAMGVSDTQTGMLHYVQTFIPGKDIGVRGADTGMDREMVILLAHYEGVGRGPDGTFYPGANSNASGVAVLLETARLLQGADYQPYRTVMLVAWAGEETLAPPSFWHMLRSRTGWLERYKISAVVEVAGVAAGTSDTLLLDRGTSGRLTEVVQQAARRLKVSASTLGTGIRGVYSGLYPYPDPKIPYVALTWEGSHSTAHTAWDAIDNIQPDRLRNAGRVASLAVMYLAHEKEY